MTPDRPRTYLVVGASGAIGSAVARRLAQPGVQVVLHYSTNREAIGALEQQLRDAGAHAVAVQATLTTEAACAELADTVLAAAGVPDGVAWCAGRVPWQPWAELSGDDWAAALFEHCVAPFTLARLTVPRMTSRGSGAFVYLSSIAAKYGGSPRTIHYAAAKAALEAAMRGLAREVATAGIRINGVRSGFVQTKQQAGRSAAEIADRVAKIPMRRGGTPDEIAAAVVFLLSPEAGFVTGETLTVAGGD